MNHLSRRALLRTGWGLGALALQELLENELVAAPRGRARQVIALFMAGGPSQLDLFTPKPQLAAHDGQPLPPSVAPGERFAFIKGTPRLLASPFAFAQHGQSGAWISSLLPHAARIVDELAFLHAVKTTEFNHGPAQILMSTGHPRVGRPSLGAWLSYGLGSLNRDLPDFVVMLSGERQPDGGRSCWGSGFLPTNHQGVELASRVDPVLFLRDPPGVTRQARRDSLDTIAALDRLRPHDPDVEARIANFELAFRMQMAVPELADLGAEPASVHALYGTTPGRPSFANNCLLARRLIERGCRMVQLFHRGWDHHGTSRSDDLTHRLPVLCRETDQATAALISDLKARGLLDTTLVIWGGEFGRTPMVEGRNGSLFLGRDHHPRAFSLWMAGGGARGGASLGETDDLGYHPTAGAVDVHDVHATILHLLGVDHTRLTYSFEGRPFRLTDVSGSVIDAVVR